MYNDTIGRSILLDGFYEKALVNNIISNLNFDTKLYNCIDVGANIGNHTLQFHKFFKCIYSFEPQRRTFKILQLNTEFISNIQTFNYGLSKKKDKVEFIIPKSHTGGASHLNQYNKDHYFKETCELQKFDDNFNIEVGFVKIDVEGNEKDVLFSMEKTLEKHKPCISMEIGENHKTTIEILDYLKILGYSDYYLPKKHFSNKFFKSDSIFNLISRFILKSLFPNKPNQLVKVSKSEILKYNFIQLLTISSSQSKFTLKI
jgi:FkbM family methyltransferase